MRVGARARNLPVRAKVAYRTGSGAMYRESVESFLRSRAAARYQGRINLILTSPPFPLNRKKSYGNLTGDDYLRWLEKLAPKLARLLTPRGSIVLEIGNAWEPGSPVMSTLSLKALIAFQESGRLYLCQQFVGYNKARLPAPAEWVTIRRIRVKDAYTHVWWMSPSLLPKARNRAVLNKYSHSMIRLLKTKKYNAGRRPSEYNIGKTSFLGSNAGSIPSNVIEFSNTASRSEYLDYCKRRRLTPHPARMHPRIAEFFVKFLTSKGDLVLDPFAGSNTTGAIAEGLGRRWIAVEKRLGYIEGSKGRFDKFAGR